MPGDKKSSIGSEQSGSSRSSVLSLAYKDKAALYAAYMPWLKTGGIFVPTNRAYSLGDDIYLLLSLMDEPGKLPITGKVVWITPPDAHGSKTQGVGVAFQDNEGGSLVRNKIETVLGSALKAKHKTHTL
jgi:type IV pilus assembly protein PilZ